METASSRVWLDCETTSLHAGRRAWEVAAIVRRPGQPDTEHQWFVHISCLDLANADPVALRVGGFWARHPQADLVHLIGNLAGDPREGLPDTPPAGQVWWETDLLARIAELVAGKAVICGSNPAFDMATLGPRMEVHGITPGWHYHPCDVPERAAGWLNGRGLPAPTKSDAISLACGVDPAGYDRHTALGDCKWTRDLLDLIDAGPPAGDLDRALAAVDPTGLNRGTDPVSRRVYALIFNGLTGALREFMSLSERERVSSAIYDALRTGGVEVRLDDGLAKLRAVSTEIERQHPASPSSSPVDAPADDRADILAAQRALADPAPSVPLDDVLARYVDAPSRPTGTPGPDTEMWCVCGAPDRTGPCARCIPDTTGPSTDGESE